MMLLSVLTLLSPKQQQLVDNLSAMVIHESSDLDKMTTSDSDKGEVLRTQKGVDLSKVFSNVRNSKFAADIRLARMLNILRGDQ